MSCRADFFLTQNDRGPVLRATLLQPDGKTAQDLTGATVTIEIQKADGTGAVFGGACTVVDAVNGIVGYAWQAGDTAASGLFNFRIKAIVGGVPMHWPNNKSYVLFIEPALVSA